MRIALIFNKTRPDTTGVYFERACRKMSVAYDHWELRQAAQIPRDYDLYVRIDHGDDYLMRLPQRLRPAVFLAFDTHLRHSWRKIRHTAHWYDIVFCCHREGARRLPGAEWLPVACDWELHGVREASRIWDLAFVGTDGGVPRKFYLQALRERYPNSFLGPADYTQLGAIYSQARIGFNYSIADDVNMRVFEVLAARALLVTNALRHDDLHRLGLEDGQHLVLYRTPQELLERLEYYVAHPEEREAIAQAGCIVVRQHHTYTHRMTRLLERVQQRFGVSELSPCVSS